MVECKAVTRFHESEHLPFKQKFSKRFMFNLFDPTIAAPSSKSPRWYAEFHTGFYISQITNNVLLAGFEGMCEAYAEDGNMPLSGNSQLEKGLRIALANLADSLKTHGKRNQILFYSMGLDVKDTRPNLVNVDLNHLLQQTGEQSWLAVIKGFLNVWEFLFLFSVSESTLKSILNVKPDGMRGFINAVFRPNPGFAKRLLGTHGIDRNFCVKFWDLFVEVRNIYSHSHGYLTLTDIESIRGASEEFNSCFETYLQRIEHEAPINATLMRREKGYFPKDELSENKFFLIKDAELNLFRNFIATFMFELQLEQIGSA